jgi:hypothetical protein
MAILKGFPASNTISPSVRVTEKDLTFLVNETQQAQRLGLVGFASKGPINTPTQVTSIADFNTKFGYPHPSDDNPCYLAYAAMMALQVTNEVYIVRCAETNPISPYYAATSEVEVPSAGDAIDVLGATAVPQANTISFSEDLHFSWRLNGVLSSKSLVLLSDDNRPSPNTGNPYTMQEIVDDLNSQLDSVIDGIEFYRQTTSDTGGTYYKIGLKTTWAYGPNSSLEIVSIANSLFGGAVSYSTVSTVYNNTNNVLGLATDSTKAIITGSADRYPLNGYTSLGNYTFDGSMTNLNLHVVVEGTGNVNYDGKLQIINLNSLRYNTWTATQIATAINAQLSTSPSLFGGFTATAVSNSVKLTAEGYGKDSKVAVKSTGSLAIPLGFSTTAAVSGTSTSGTSNDTGSSAYAILRGVDAASTDYSFKVTGDTPGSECDNIFVVCTNDTSGGTFNLNVYMRNPLTQVVTQVESWGNLTKDATSQYYVETYVSSLSNYINVVDNTNIDSPPANSPQSGTSRLFLTGGTDGIPPVTEPELRELLLIGDPLNLSGLNSFSEPEQTDIDTLAVPGASSTAVIQALINLCANYRQDCFAIIDPPSGMTPTEVIQWQNGQSALNNVRFDSDFAALYWPWIIYRDTYNGLDVTIPPSCGIVTAFARSDNLSFPWFAPAGLLRGIIPGAIGLAMVPTLAEKDALYGNGNAVNPIVKYVGNDNYMVWGQKTLQRTPTALDRVNVRRMLFYVEKQLRAQARGLLFEPHTAELRQKFTNIASSILQTVKANSGVYDYTIKCDEELNTANVIDRNEMRAQIGLQPTRATEFIFIEFSLHRTGSFTESTSVLR